MGLSQVLLKMRAGVDLTRAGIDLESADLGERRTSARHYGGLFGCIRATYNGFDDRMSSGSTETRRASLGDQ